MNKTLSANSSLSHYKIVSKIGAGGMGEVFLATDTKLKRKVLEGDGLEFRFRHLMCKIAK